MKSIFILCSIIFSIPLLGSAQSTGPRSLYSPGVGVAYYGAPAFEDEKWMDQGDQCGLALSVFKGVRAPKLSTLWGSFGPSLNCIERFLKLPGQKTLLIHATNETCKRNGRRCTPLDQPDIKTRIREISAFVSKRIGSAQFIVSTGLEDDLSNSAFLDRIKIMRSILPPEVLIARNPNAQNYISNGADLVELHGASRVSKRGACSYSNDGFDLDLSRDRKPVNNFLSMAGLHSSIAGAQKAGCLSFIWWDTQGARFNIEHGWNVPRSRNIYLFRSDISAVNKILRRYQ